jgi:hypothetical protein
VLSQKVMKYQGQLNDRFQATLSLAHPKAAWSTPQYVDIKPQMSLGMF